MQKPTNAPSTPFLTAPQLLAAFDGGLPDLTIRPERKSAAVALIFSGYGEDLHVCMGRRATYEGDPWSGDMAFPGGKAELEDVTFNDVAKRETWEETGLVLTDDALIGALDGFETRGGAQRKQLWIRPIIYYLTSPPAPFNLGPELSAAFWISTRHLWDADQRTTLRYDRLALDFPAIDYQGNIIWGLSLGVIEKFSQRVRLPLQFKWPQR